MDQVLSPALTSLTPVLTSDQAESHKRFSKLPDTPFCLDLKMRPSCQTLSNASHFKAFVK